VSPLASARCRCICARCTHRGQSPDKSVVLIPALEGAPAAANAVLATPAPFRLPTPAAPAPPPLPMLSRTPAAADGPLLT
jgi:hypothetical protein